MQRYFADVDKQYFVHLSKDDEHHVLHVMRMKKGDEIEVVSNQKVFLCCLDETNPLTISVIHEIANDVEISEDVTLLFALTKGDKIDIFHGLSHELPHGIPRSIKKVVTMHDLIVWRYPRFYSLVDRMVHKSKQRHACHIADVVVAISEQTKSDLIKYLKVPESKIKVLYQSCDNIFWQPVGEKDKAEARETYHLPERYVICVGSIEERKNQVAAVKALAELPSDIHLVIVGRPHGNYYHGLQSEIRRSKLTDRVHILTDAEFEDFPALYANAIASVYVSQFEGFGIPIVESMCCDVPVVTSNVSSMPEAGGDAALYANPNNPHEIAQQLQLIVGDPQFRASLVEKGRQQRMKFSPDKIISDFYAMYTELCPEKEEE